MADEKDRGKKFAKDFLEKWARAEREEGPAEDALAREEEAVRANPEDADAWFRRGLILADLERWPDALASFERAGELRPDLPRLHLAKSYVLSRLGRPREAAEEYRQAVQDLAAGIDEDLAKKLAREEEVEEALTALAEDLRRQEEPPEIVEGLEELESLAEEVKAAEEDFPAKMARWAAEGYDVAPLREVLEQDPDRVRTAFFQFEQNVLKIAVLRDTVNALDPAGIEEDIAKVRLLFRAPYQIWRVEAEMALLLEKAEEKDRARRARITPSPRPPVVPRPRVPSAVNGLRVRQPPGQVNGLINGVRSARAGLTNGLTNGLGFTNGLAGRRFLVQARRGWIRILLIPLVAVLLLSVGLVLPPAPVPPPGGIAVDGGFGDWRGVSGYVQSSTTTNLDVDLRGYKVHFQDGYLSLYANVSGNFFGTRTGLHVLYAFIDADGRPETGYDEGRLGANVLLEVRGGNDTAFSTHAWTWEGADPQDWNGWGSLATSLQARASGSEFEAKASLGEVPGFDPRNATISLYVDDQEGARSASALLVRPAYGALEVVQEPAPEVVSGVAEFFNITFRAVGAPATVTNVTVAWGPNARPVDREVPPFSLLAEESRTIRLRVDATGLSARTFLDASLVRVVSDRPATIRGPPARGYVDALPVGKAVDGLYREWTIVRPDENDVANPNVDLLATAAEDQSGTTFLYARVEGDALGGDPSPVARLRPRQGPGGPPSAPPIVQRRVGEDLLLAYFDAPAVPGGVSVGPIVADTLLEIRGRHGVVRSVAAYAWENRWTPRGTSMGIASGPELEASISIPGVDLRGAAYVVETLDWTRTGDRTDVEGVRGMRSGPGGASYRGGYEAVFPPDAGGFVRFLAPGGAGLSWRLPSLFALADGEATPLAAPHAAPLRIEGFTATYAEAYDAGAVDVVYEADPTSLKETILVRRLPDVPASASLLLELPVVREGDLLIEATGEDRGGALLVEGELAFVDGRGLSLVLPPPWAEDAAGNRIDLRYRLRADHLGIEIPGAWLDAAAFPIVIDPTVTYTLRNDGPSYKKGEQLGYSVAVGDFNGDGYADVLAGAPFNSLADTNVGYAYIYYGPFTGDRTTPDVRINGTGPTSSRFGFAVAAGKFNGDQYWDALVARLSTPGLSPGDVSIYHGSASLSGDINTANVRFVPPANHQNFGWTVAAGNVDNANFDDVLISEPGRNTNDGVVYLYKSPFSSPVTTANYTLKPSSSAGGQLGRGGVAVGTIDSDAYPDIVVGEPIFSSSAGRVQFYKGNSFLTGSGDRTPNATLSSQAAGEQFGYALAVGKLNGDAYADLIVGAPFRSTNLGAAYLYTANSNGTGLTTGASPAVTILNQAPTERFGSSVLVLDFDDDGTPGAVVGATHADAGGTRRGRVYWFDAPLSDQTVDETMSGSQTDERFGQSLAGGRFSNDVRTILAIGAYLWDKNAANNADNDGRAVVAEVPEPAALLVGGVLLIGLSARSLQRRRLVRKR